MELPRPLTLCPVCMFSKRDPKEDVSRGIFYFDCPVCGEFSISEEAAQMLLDESQLTSRKYLLSGVLRNASLHGHAPSHETGRRKTTGRPFASNPVPCSRAAMARA